MLLVDLPLATSSSAEVEKILRELPEVVTSFPRGSVLIFSDFTAATFDAEAIRVMKETAVFDKPYIKKTAWIGAEDFPREFSESLSSFSRREFPTFKNRDEALAWLVKD